MGLRTGFGSVLLFALVTFSVAGLQTTEAATVSYSITGSTNDWSGTFEVPSLDAQLDSETGVQASASGAGQLAVAYVGSNSSGWMVWDDLSGSNFNFTSPDMYAVMYAGGTWSGTWNDLLGNTYALTDVNTFKATTELTGSNGSISFSLAPTPIPVISPLGLALGSALLILLSLTAMPYLNRRRSAG